MTADSNDAARPETTAAPGDTLDPEEIEHAVSADPRALNDHIEAIDRYLETGGIQERAAVGRAFRTAAQDDAGNVRPFVDRFIEFLDDDNGSIRLSGALSISAVAKSNPDAVVDFVPKLVSLLRSTDAPGLEMAAIEALGAIGEATPTAITDADPIVADRLETATHPIRVHIVTVFAGAVVQKPSSFPETVEATEAALDDESDRVKRYAAATLAAYADADAASLSSLESIHERVADLEARVNAGPLANDENVAGAKRTLRELLEETDG
ncbi:MAG: hypothetical protein PPP58_01730 [Natronomonas sp.]